MQGVIPYLAMEDARAAVAFYQKAFGARLDGQMAVMPGSEKVANAGLEINGGMLMLSDHFPEMGHPPAAGGLGYTLQLVILDGDHWWNRAVEAGCEVVVPFTKQFWGDRYGRLRDPFGIEWGFNEPSPENQALAAQQRTTLHE